MVESKNQGDGQVRNVIYAKWREDKPAEKGYSKELISVKTEPKYYDNLGSFPPLYKDCYTFLDHFERQIKAGSDRHYLGTRAKLNENEFGEYEWLSYRQVESLA
jgi:hypothetical protein